MADTACQKRPIFTVEAASFHRQRVTPRHWHMVLPCFWQLRRREGNIRSFHAINLGGGLPAITMPFHTLLQPCLEDLQDLELDLRLSNADAAHFFPSQGGRHYVRLRRLRIAFADCCHEHSTFVRSNSLTFAVNRVIWPQLTHLSLDNAVIDDVNFAAFLRHHRSTMKALTLIDPGLRLPDADPQPVFWRGFFHTLRTTIQLEKCTLRGLLRKQDVQRRWPAWALLTRSAGSLPCSMKARTEAFITGQGACPLPTYSTYGTGRAANKRFVRDMGACADDSWRWQQN